MAARPGLITGALCAVLALVACGSSDPIAFPPPPAPPPPGVDASAAARGEQLYGVHCASCHKPDLSGEENWREADDDGKYPAPPHDASGHTWHHSDRLLLSLIRDGAGAGPTNMPTYAGVLSDDEINDIIEYFKSNWPERERAFQWQVTWQEANR